MDSSMIMKVEKIYNKYNHERVKQELVRLMDVKYPEKKAFELVKHLFHGTRHNDPANIYQSEDGLDMRYSDDGVNGFGIYFANSSAYSHNYKH